MKLKLIYITLPNKVLATNIATILVQEKLAACVNILGSLESFYLWDNKLTQSEEVLLFAKTTAELENSLTNRVKELHPYEVPCIIGLDISSGNPEFLKWIYQ